jgi:hypothetical protein
LSVKRIVRTGLALSLLQSGLESALQAQGGHLRAATIEQSVAEMEIAGQPRPVRTPRFPGQVNLTTICSVISLSLGPIRIDRHSRKSQSDSAKCDTNSKEALRPAEYRPVQRSERQVQFRPHPPQQPIAAENIPPRQGSNA